MIKTNPSEKQYKETSLRKSSGSGLEKFAGTGRLHKEYPVSDESCAGKGGSRKRTSIKSPELSGQMRYSI
jgi:hypothetical protein